MSSDLIVMTERLEALARRRAGVWEALWNRQPIGRIAVAVNPGPDARQEAKRSLAALALPEPGVRPAAWTPAWRDALIGDLEALVAGLSMPGDAFLALNVPRFVHGQSQGICDVFGARVEPQPDGNVYVHPLPPEPRQIAAVEPRPLASSQYWGAVEYARYAQTATGGRFAIRNPVMTGPFDTANYLLGTTVLMEWVYSEPGALRALLDKVTAVIIGMARAFKAAAGGRIAPAHFSCVRGGFDLCSECRSLVSREIYEEFEAPYLRRVGEALGPYAIHSCGSWERTVASAVADPNLRAMNGQIRENDLGTLCGASGGRMTYSIAPSVGLDERYTWPDSVSFLEFVLRTVPPSQPLEIRVDEANLPTWNDLCRATGATHNAVACAPAARGDAQR
jgi:hypothetical protein